MSRVAITKLQWDHRYVAIFKCFRKADRSAQKDVSELVVASDGEIESNPNLRRVLRRLQHDLVFKRLYRYADNPTSRLLTFRPYPEGQENKGQKRLKTLLRAKDEDEVRDRALELAQRYVGIPGVREGILFFLISRGKLDRDVAENCLFIFKCDFEAVSQITPGELFRQVEDAIVEQSKKGALYPYFDRGQFDFTIVRVFDELGETQYWLDFMDLGERKSEYEPPQEAAVDQLSIEYPRIAEKYAEQFEALPSVRSLASKDRWISPDDRLSTPQVKALNEAITARTGEQRITLRLGEVRFTAPLSQYGQTWIIAEEGDQRYVLVKGSKLENRTRVLTPIDLTDFASLEEAAAELDIS